MNNKKKEEEEKDDSVTVKPSSRLLRLPQLLPLCLLLSTASWYISSQPELTSLLYNSTSSSLLKKTERNPGAVALHKYIKYVFTPQQYFLRLHRSESNEISHSFLLSLPNPSLHLHMCSLIHLFNFASESTRKNNQTRNESKKNLLISHLIFLYKIHISKKKQTVQIANLNVVWLIVCVYVNV